MDTAWTTYIETVQDSSLYKATPINGVNHVLLNKITNLIYVDRVTVN